MPVYRGPKSQNWIIEFTYSGQRFRKSSGTSNKREPLELERRWRSQIYDQATLGQSVSMTLDEALDRYWSTIIVPRGRKRSAQNTLYLLERIRRDFGSETPLEALARVSDWADRLLGAGLSPSTVNRNFDAMKAIDAATASVHPQEIGATADHSLLDGG